MPSKVLVVDDEPHLRRVVSLYLRSRNYDVTTAENGTEAIRLVQENRPDLIIADISMPGMDGFELCSRLRRDPSTRTIPFIFLTAKDQDQDKIKARKVGSDDYLTKPCPLDQLAEHVETVIDRIEQAKKIPLDQIGLNGRLEDVNVLDLIQMIELSQKTGALVLSHGERTGTLYFRDGVIVDAGIQSPKREEPLFVLLGWKAGHYLFIPEAVPEQLPITASLANLLFEDLRRLEQREQRASVAVGTPAARPRADTNPTWRILTRLEEVTQRARTGQASTTIPHIARILVVGVIGSGKSELIESLVKDLSPSHWAAVGIEEPRPEATTNFGLVRLSRDTVLHLIAIRAEKRFRPIWEQCLPEALGVILLVSPSPEGEIDHLQTFLKAQKVLAPNLPVHALVQASAPSFSIPGLAPSDHSYGSTGDQALRLSILDRIVERWLDSQPNASIR